MKVFVAVLCVASVACGGGGTAHAPGAPPPVARSLLLITIDSLRADRVGAYGYAPARTPHIDQLSRAGVRFRYAYAAAPLTLPSHASLLTGRYPAGHGARNDGVSLDLKTPTLADALARAGVSTAAFIGSSSLDRRLGLIKGFHTYNDRMPRNAEGRAALERPGREVVDAAVRWLNDRRSGRFFMWVHLNEPHAPYGDAARGGTASGRYDDEIVEADRQTGRLIDALGAERASTLVVLTSDHGEAFGEHGEFGHGLFVYDTTLRVPLIVAGGNLPQGKTVSTPASVVDVASTAMHLLGVTASDVDGVNLAAAMYESSAADRELYAESSVPLLDFGWSALRSLRAGNWKYIDAPRPELYDLSHDPGETTDLIKTEQSRAADLRTRIARHAADPAGVQSTIDPKDRRGETAALAQIATGEVRGQAAEQQLRQILRTDPKNPQANLRLGHALLEGNKCREAVPRFRAALAAGRPSADPHLGLAECEARERRFDAAVTTLREAERIEPANPVVLATLGRVLLDAGRAAEAIDPLQRALTIDPDLHHARFTLANAFARAGRRAEAAAMARELLRRLPADAPQRADVERLASTAR